MNAWATSILKLIRNNLIVFAAFAAYDIILVYVWVKAGQPYNVWNDIFKWLTLVFPISSFIGTWLAVRGLAPWLKLIISVLCSLVLVFLIGMWILNVERAFQAALGAPVM